ncbi:hypothetical protein [Peribacillus asahii]|uniref:GP88 family protein n=1 Tax=Peribacillus asahii TaxID=228899 RepID=UPI00380AC641
MTMTVKELKQASKDLINLTSTRIQAKPFQHYNLTQEEYALVATSFTTINKMRKAELEELSEALHYLHEKVKEMDAQATIIEESAVAETAVASESVKEAKKQKSKKEPKYGTVEKRQQLVQDKMDLASRNVKAEDWKIYIGRGNQKLNGILTWSLTPVETCPSATKECIMKCYALKDYYRNWDNVSKSQYINYMLSKRDDFVDVMTKMLKIEALKNEVENQVNGTEKKLTVRIHVSGDFYSYEYFEKWVKITENLRGLPIQFGCYTKSIQYIKIFTKKNNLSIDDININFMFSLWADTSEKMKNMAGEMNMNVFTAVGRKEKISEDYIQCPDDINKGACGTTCNMCYEKNSTANPKRIAIRIH